MVRSRWLTCLFAALCCAGCDTEAPSTNGPPSGASVGSFAGSFAPPAEAGSLPRLCERPGRDDAIRDLFCAEDAPRIESLAQLQSALGLVTYPRDASDHRTSAVILAHSTALSGDVVSELNPRAIVSNGSLFFAFSRGVQQVEFAAVDRDPTQLRLNFYLLTFEQACNDVADGCRAGDLYTPQIESGWTKVRLEDDEDLKNTASDCRQCHQRGVERPVLLMREFDGPWTHFFGPDQDEPMGFPEPTGSALLRDYLRAKGDESYASLPTDILRNTVGFMLQSLVNRPQPLIFDGSRILNERWPWRDGYSAAPEPSATWYTAYEAFKRGEQLALPYFAPRVTDPVKQANLTAAYQAYRAGMLAAAELPDFSDIFPDDPQVRAEIGLQTEPAATPAQTLIQACGQCHNDVLDQTISRAKFNIALGRMSRAELDLAIARVKAQRDAPGVMPPPGRRIVAPSNLEALIEYLERDVRPAEDDAMLEHAAQRGMVSVGQ